MTHPRRSMILWFAAALLWPAAASSGLDTKRGIAGGAIDNANALNARWYYDWSNSPPPGLGDFRGQYLPMIWSANTDNIDARVDNILGFADTLGVERVLGFNEPERVNQANMSVSRALDVWQVMSDRFAGTGIKLVSPAGSGGAGERWLAEFMAGADARDLTVDEIAFHWYGDVTAPHAAATFLAAVDRHWETYQRPVWITEFGGLDFGEDDITSPDLIRANEAFLDAVIPELDARDFVSGYAWWQFGQSDNGEERDTRLIDNLDGVWTPTGLGDQYIPSYANGETFDLGGVDHGGDNLYLRGGRATNTGAPLAGGVGSILALHGESSLGGSADWGAAGGSVVVAEGAALEKIDDNTIRLGVTRIDNDGVLSVSQGVLRLEAAPLSGSGTLRLNAGGTITLGKPSDRAGAAIHQLIELRGGTLHINPIIDGNHRLTGGGVILAQTRFAGAGDLTVEAPLVSGSEHGIVKEGPGRLTLTAANTYAGETLIRGGTLALAGGGSIEGSSHIHVRTGGTFDVAGRPAGYTLVGQRLTLDGPARGDLHATAGSTVAVNSSNALAGDLTLDASTATGGGRITGDLDARRGATVRVGGEGIHALAAAPGLVTAGLALEFDAARDTPGDNAWTDAAGGQALTFAAPAPTQTVNDPALPGLTAAYHIPGTGGAAGLNGFFELGAPVRSRGDATFEVWFNLSDPHAAGDQVLFEAGGEGRGVSFSIDGETLSFNVNGDAPQTTSLDAPVAPGWHHAVGVIDLQGDGDDRANDSVSLYLDAQHIATLDGLLIDDWAGGNLTGIGDAASSLGAGGSPVPFHDAIASVRFYEALAFDQARVQQNFNAVTGSPNLPETLLVEGGFTQDTASSLRLDIAGDDPTRHDRLEVAGHADLAGTLSLRLELGYTPEIGDVFDVLTAGSRSGAFDTIEGALIGDSIGLAVTYLEQAVRVRATVPGDVNFDDRVDVSDLAVVAQHFDASGHGWQQGDFNGDGRVDAADVGLLEPHFDPIDGVNVAEAFAELRAQYVPEPASGAALLLGAAGLLRRRR